MQDQQLSTKFKGLEPAQLETHQEKAVMAFNLMEGKIDWAALEAITEYLEISDIDLLIDSLLILKAYQDKQRAAQ